MILSFPLLMQGGELHDMPVQIDPLDRLQSRVMQETLQMIPHRASAPRHGGNRKPRIFIEQINILRPQLPLPAKDLHRLTHLHGAALEMNQRFAIEIHVKKSSPVLEEFDRLEL